MGAMVVPRSWIFKSPCQKIYVQNGGGGGEVQATAPAISLIRKVCGIPLSFSGHPLHSMTSERQLRGPYEHAVWGYRSAVLCRKAINFLHRLYYNPSGR